MKINKMKINGVHLSIKQHHYNTVLATYIAIANDVGWL